MSSRAIYLDNNATTAMAPEVLDAMRPYLVGFAGNASSGHARGRSARRALDNARESIAHVIHARPAEIFFTSGATESNNLALQCVHYPPEAMVLSSAAEHPSVSEPIAALGRRGLRVGLLPLDEHGLVHPLPEQFAGAALVAIQLANSETGVIQDVARWSRHLPPGCRFHCDATQAVGKIAVDFEALGVTSLSFSGHKLHGPAGIGVLCLRDADSMEPMLRGGHQQAGVRAGTEPVALAVGLAAALQLAHERLQRNGRLLARRRDELEMALLALDGVVRNGDPLHRLPNTTNLSFLGTTSEALLIALDLAGVCASAGTACASGSIGPSATLKAMGLSGERLHGAVRFSVGNDTSAAGIARAAERIAQAVAKVRNTMPAPDFGKRAFAGNDWSTPRGLIE